MLLQGHAEGKKHKAKVKRAILEKEEALKASQPPATQSENPGEEARSPGAAEEKKKADTPKEVAALMHYPFSSSSSSLFRE